MPGCVYGTSAPRLRQAAVQRHPKLDPCNYHPTEFALNCRDTKWGAPELATHKFTPTRFYNAIGTAEPAFTVGDGDTVVTTTLDAHGFDEHGTQLGGPPNPMTGPFFVTGAGPGDTLQVRIDRMTPNRATGWTFSVLAPN